MLDHLWHIVEHTMEHCISIVPFLFLTYLVMEYIEHKAGEKVQRTIEKAGWFGPVIGAVAGAVPQCGFSAAASNFYAGRVITLGTLMAIYLSTSDEMLPILISNKADISVILKLLSIKVVIGMMAGLAIDAVLRGRMKKQPEVAGAVSEHVGVVNKKIISEYAGAGDKEDINVHAGVGEYDEHHHDGFHDHEHGDHENEHDRHQHKHGEFHDHEHGDHENEHGRHQHKHEAFHGHEHGDHENEHDRHQHKHEAFHDHEHEHHDHAHTHIHELCEQENCHCENGIFYSAVIHTVHIFLYILVIAFVLNLVIENIGEDKLSEFLLNRPVVGPLIAGVVGLIPNCASSVVITQLFIDKALGLGAMMAGLLVNAGVGVLVLFRVNRHRGENLKIVGLLYAIGVVAGIVLDLLPITL